MLTPEIEHRFGGIQKIYGASSMEKLLQSHVAVVGVGGVGSWAAEAIARSGVGNVTLVDLDDICVSNVNRQVHAITNTVGKLKVNVTADRIREIHPECNVTTMNKAFDHESYNEFFKTNYDCVIDAIDSFPEKLLLVGESSKRKIPVIVTGAAGGRRDSTKVIVTDLAKTVNDQLLAHVRKRLRKDYGFPRRLTKPFRVSCVYSTELPKVPFINGCDERNVHVKGPLDCRTGYGTVSFVTGTFGLFAANLAVEELLRDKACS